MSLRIHKPPKPGPKRRRGYTRPDPDPHWARRLARAMNAKRVMRPASVRREYNRWGARKMTFIMHVLSAGPMRRADLFTYWAAFCKHQFGPGYGVGREVEALRSAGFVSVRRGVVVSARLAQKESGDSKPGQAFQAGNQNAKSERTAA